jgi:hypothetical protein
MVMAQGGGRRVGNGFIGVGFLQQMVRTTSSAGVCKVSRKALLAQ